MASTTGIPDQPPAVDERPRDQRETEPLLGRPGDASQVEGKSFLRNLSLGTGVVAQIGILLLFVLIWASVFLKPLSLFSGHPLAQSLAVVILVQSVMTLQPTHSAEQKRVGQIVHASLNLAAFLSLVAGVTIIEFNKISNHLDHFHSVHGYLGVITSIIILLQYLVGFTMWATPKLYGSEDNAKSIWKYHRYSGYVVLTLLLATICAATKTEFNEGVLHIKLWATIILSIVILVGVFPRIQKQKLGFRASRDSD